jgi:hypothetical protein
MVARQPGKVLLADHGQSPLITSGRQESTMREWRPAHLYVPAAVRKAVFVWISEVAHMYPAY